MVTNSKRLYIAYGSNLNLEQMSRRCPTATTVGTAQIEGYELIFRSGVANIEPSEAATVPALVWEIQPGDEAALDRYEGFPTLYEKRDIEVELNGERVTAMAYVMAQELEAALPTMFYFETIEQGYASAGFAPDTLYAALDRTEHEMERGQLGGEMKWGW